MSFVAYNEELIDTTLEANRRSEVRTIVIAVVIVIIVIVIALLIYFIFRYLQNRNNQSGGGNNNNGGVNGKCLTDATCPVSSPICLVATGLCVQCRDNTQCSGTISKCNTATNSCVQCLATTDCGECEECQNGACRAVVKPAAPTITAAVYIGFNTFVVRWTAVPGAINYVIEYLGPGDTGIPGVDAMLPQTVAGNLTEFIVPRGQNVCGVHGIGNVYVTSITACGRSDRSKAFPLEVHCS
jgi:hypothetical protein